MNQICLLLFALFACSQADDSPIVQIKAGKVQGTVLPFGDHDKVYLYQGIRYGHAQRFEKPIPATEQWTGVRNVTEYRDSCPLFGFSGQMGWYGNSTLTESEDCLYVNVWKPAKESTKPRSVMVWIHGGAFATGMIFSTIYDSRQIVNDGDVVVVQIAYRLGPLGFLFGGGVIGNLGFYDQILGLKWIRENIQHFGGDPENVTIFGESAGSMSIGALVQSPLARGLFSRAILQSGTALESTAQSKETALIKTKLLVHALNCPNDNLTIAVDCLREKSVDELKNASISDIMKYVTFYPIHGDDLLPFHPVEGLKLGKFDHNVDFLFGLCNNEGAVFSLPEILNSKSIDAKKAHEYIVKLLSMYAMSEEKAITEIADFYTRGIGPNTTLDEVKLIISAPLGDFTFDCPVVLFFEQIAKLNPNKHYYSYRLMQTATPTPKWFGVPHSSDIPFLFNIPSIPSYSNTEAGHLSRDMIRTWAQFAKTGNPGTIGSVQWEEAYNRNSTNITTRFMSLNSSNYTMVSGFYTDKCNRFWKSKIFV